MKPSTLVGAVLSGLRLTVTSGLFTTLLILFYMLVSGETFLRRMVEILPRFKDSARRSNCLSTSSVTSLPTC